MSCTGHTSTTGWHCGACHLTFGGLSGFDGHRVGNVDHRRCLDPSELTAKGWTHDGKVWRTPLSAADQARLARIRDTAGGF